jgi:hypothetical protein
MMDLKPCDWNWDRTKGRTKGLGRFCLLCLYITACLLVLHRYKICSIPGNLGSDEEHVGYESVRQI